MAIVVGYNKGEILCNVEVKGSQMDEIGEYGGRERQSFFGGWTKFYCLHTHANQKSKLHKTI